MPCRLVHVTGEHAALTAPAKDERPQANGEQRLVAAVERVDDVLEVGEVGGEDRHLAAGANQRPYQIRRWSVSARMRCEGYVGIAQTSRAGRSGNIRRAARFALDFE